MTKLEELKAAYEAAIETDVDFHFHIDGACDAEDEVALMHFWQSAVDLMPQLLEAVEALEAIRARFNGVFDHPALVKYGPLDVSIERDMYRLACNVLESLK